MVRAPATAEIDQTAVAAAEQDGLRFLLRVRLVVLAVVALSPITNYAPLLLALGLVTVSASNGKRS